MSPPDALERFLARLYTDDALAERAREDPQGVALAAGLSTDDAARIAGLDWDDVALARESFAAKRRQKERAAPPRRSAIVRLWRWVRRGAATVPRGGAPQ